MLNFLSQKKILIPIILIICMLLFIVISLASRGAVRNVGDFPDVGYGYADETSEIQIPSDLIGVHITGAVNSPGFYEVERQTRVNDLIEIAGGVTEYARLDAINLAEFVFDQQQIHVPADGEVVPGDPGRLRINLNTATAMELQQLSGVGEVTAQNIIDLRNRMGGFRRVEDIMNVRGISVNRFEAMRDYIIVP